MLGHKRDVYTFQNLSKSMEWLLRKSILSFGTLSWIKVVQVHTVKISIFFRDNDHFSKGNGSFWKGIWAID